MRRSRATEQRRLMLRPHEIAWLLEVPRSRVKRMLQRGEIPNSSRGAHYRVGCEDALKLVRERTRSGETSPLAELLLEAIVERRLYVSPEEAEWLTPEAAFTRARETGEAALHATSRT